MMRVKVLVEGATDHQFVGGLLAAQGWHYQEQGRVAAAGQRQFLYRSPQLDPSVELELLNTESQDKVWKRARAELENPSEPVTVVLVLDDDSDGTRSGPNRVDQFKTMPGQPVTDFHRKSDPAGKWAAHLVIWRVEGAAPEGVPDKQALERLACTALAAELGRGPDVAKFIQPPLVVEGIHKHQAMAYFALHMPDVGNHEFYRAIWAADEKLKLPGLDDTKRTKVRDKLTELTKACGAWQVFESLKPQTP